MFGKNCKISSDALDKAKAACEILHCSLEEFIETTVLERAEQVINNATSAASQHTDVESITKKLKGLGYLE